MAQSTSLNLFEKPREKDPKEEAGSSRRTMDHLGMPIRARSSQKFKYARTYTIVYDAEKEKDRREEKIWQLLRDTRKVTDISVRGIRRLHHIFVAAVSPEQRLLGPRTFRLVLAKFGIKDMVLMERLFTTFCEPSERLDYREFLRVLVSVNEEPIDVRVELLFEIHDADQSGMLSHAEITQIVVSGVAAEARDAVTENFNKIWAEIRANQQEQDGYWMTPSRSSGISKADLVHGCRQLVSVREFLAKMLTREPPKAEEVRVESFQARLKKLQTEVIRDTKAADRADQPPEPAAAAARAGHRSGERLAAASDKPADRLRQAERLVAKDLRHQHNVRESMKELVRSRSDTTGFGPSRRQLSSLRLGVATRLSTPFVQPPLTAFGKSAGGGRRASSKSGSVGKLPAIRFVGPGSP